MTRHLYCAAGCLSVLIGIIGILLPLLPTTPFIILAAYCFSRGSPRLHAWLRDHRLFGGMLRDWEEGGVIRPRAKLLSTVMMSVLLVYPLGFMTIPHSIKVLIVILCGSVLIYIWSRPSIIKKMN